MPVPRFTRTYTILRSYLPGLGLSAAVVAAAFGVYSLVDDGRISGPVRPPTGLGGEGGGGPLVVSGRFGPVFTDVGSQGRVDVELAGLGEELAGGDGAPGGSGGGD